MHPGLVIAIVLVLVLVVFLMRRERMSGRRLIFLDQMANENWDPIYFKWAGRERDIAGMSGRDYYLENQTYVNTHTIPTRRMAPRIYEGNRMFHDQTCYMGMPPRYRPKVPGCLRRECRIASIVEETDKLPVTTPAQPTPLPVLEQESKLSTEDKIALGELEMVGGGEFAGVEPDSATVADAELAAMEASEPVTLEDITGALEPDARTI